jgi:hypothetical protein
MYFVIHVHFYVYRHTDTSIQGLSEGEGRGGNLKEGPRAPCVRGPPNLENKQKKLFGTFFDIIV